METSTSRRPRPSRSTSVGRPRADRSFTSTHRSPNRASRSFSSGGGGRRSFSGGGNRGGGRGARKQPTFDPSQFINKNPVEIETEVYAPSHTFADFGLHADIVKAVTEQGLTTPSPIQDQIIPHIMEVKDVIGLAQTGTGKTAAFLLPLIHKMIARKHETVLILTPTRELAIQIEVEFKRFSGAFRLFSTTCVGGTSIMPQIRSLRRHQQFIIGTPGRVMDLTERGLIHPEEITTVVLDEADRMLDMGFIHDMRKILGQLPANRHTLFFSATMTKEAEKIVNDFLNRPVSISVKKKDVTNSIAQDVVPYEHAHKFDTLLTLLAKSEFERVIIFGAMKHSVEKLAQELTHNGIKAESLHGNKSHGQRQRSLTNFKSGHVRVLVATDVAARGIHVDNVTHVINYDLPNTFEDYVHRIGRTGRGAKHGAALTFIAAHPSLILRR